MPKNMIEKENPNAVKTLLEDVEKLKKISVASDWEKVQKRITFDRNKQYFFRILRNSAAILLPLFLIWQYIASPMLLSEKTTFTEVVSSSSGITEVVLPDGSHVWLNVSSKLIYPQKFAPNQRTVELIGEGYFKVSADKKKRFNVILPNKITVSAYGTEFNITSYPHFPQSQIILAEGNIEIELPNTEAAKILKPGQVATFIPENGQIEIETADIYVQTAWKDGKIIFYREKLADIAEKLSARFGVSIDFGNPELKEQVYTATFTTEGITEILDLFKQSSPIDYTITKIEDEKSNHKRHILIKQP